MLADRTRICSHLKRLISAPSLIFWVYLIAALVATLLKVSIDLRHTESGYVSKVNNFIVYRNSFYHLIQHARLYGFMPAVQDDQFIYSPTFALLFAPFAVLPKYVGVVIWCMFNALTLFSAIRLLPLDERKKAFIYWFILIELISTIQNVQSNPLVAALFIFTFVAFERRQVAFAALLVSLSFYIKIFGVIGVVLFLLYPERLKFIGWAVMWSILLFLLPLCIVSWNELLRYYLAWYEVVQDTHMHYTDNIYISVMRMIEGVRGATLSNTARFAVQIGAFAVFCVKFLNYKMYQREQFRLLILSSIMIWCIIFNHASESNHYVIAAIGAAIWYVSRNKHKSDLALLIFAYVLGLSSSWLFPSYFRDNFVVPMALKSLPFLFIWLTIEYDLTISNEFKNMTTVQNDPFYAPD